MSTTNQTNCIKNAVALECLLTDSSSYSLRETYSWVGLLGTRKKGGGGRGNIDYLSD